MSVTSVRGPLLADRGCLLKYDKVPRLKDGTSATIRPITPADEKLMIALHKTLSESTVYHRCLQVLKLSRRIAHTRPVKMCLNDNTHEAVMVAEKCNGEGERQIIGMGHLSRNPETNDAEIAIVIGDKFQGLGLGIALIEMIHEVAAANGIKNIAACLLRENLAMYHMLRRLDYDVRDNFGDPLIYAKKYLEMHDGSTAGT